MLRPSYSCVLDNLIILKKVSKQSFKLGGHSMGIFFERPGRASNAIRKENEMSHVQHDGPCLLSQAKKYQGLVRTCS